MVDDNRDIYDEFGTSGLGYDDWVESWQPNGEHGYADPAPASSGTVEHVVRHRSGVGKFMVPRDNTWAAHRALIQNSDLQLGYSHSRYPFFDEIIHQNTNKRAVWDKGHGSYEAYEVLRENIAIVRNYIMTEFFPDGSIDKEDEHKVRQLAQVSKFVAGAMNNDSLFPNPLKTTIKLDRANLPGTGAQYMYSKIVEKQAFFDWRNPLTWVMRPYYFIKGKTWSDWELPSLEDSPFSDENLRKPPPAPEVKMSEEEIDLLIAEQVDRECITTCDTEIDAAQDALHHSETERQMAYADGLDALSSDMTEQMSVDALDYATQRESVWHAKNILRNLKVKIGDMMIEHGLAPTAEGSFAVLGTLKKAVQVYESFRDRLAAHDPTIRENPAVLAANSAITKIGYVGKLEALRVALNNGDDAMASALQDEIRQMPAECHQPQEVYFGELLDQMESGLSAVIMRAQQLGEHDATTEYWLGFSDSKSLGQDPTHGRAEEAMKNNDYYNQLNAARAQRSQQAALSHNANQNRTQNTGANATSKTPSSNHQSAKQQESPQQRQASLQRILRNNQIQMNKLRNSMKTTKGAEAVQANSAKMAIASAKQQHTVQSTMRSIQVNRQAQKRQSERREDIAENRAEQQASINSPSHKKSHSLGM